MRRAFLFTAVVSLAAVAAAAVSQHRFGMQPCAWCVLQRLVFVLMALLSLAGALLASRRPTGALMAGLGVVALAQAGVAAAAWQHWVAAQSESCWLTWADRVMDFTTLDRLLPELFQARASCAEAKVQLWGLPYEAWSGLLFAGLGLYAAWLVLGRRRPTTTVQPSKP